MLNSPILCSTQVWREMGVARSTLRQALNNSMNDYTRNRAFTHFGEDVVAEQENAKINLYQVDNHLEPPKHILFP